MQGIWLVRCTFATRDEALAVARTLLEEKLIACANINDRMTALFPWEGTIQQEAEAVLLVKTTKEKTGTTIRRIKALHSYQIPSILAWETNAEKNFADWVSGEVA